jgi:hypothetical protein
LRIGARIEATFPPGLTDRNRGYTSFGGGLRLYNKLRELDTEAELSHILGSLRRLDHISYLDRNLVLAIGFRESATLVLSSRRTPVDTFDQGGLDRLYSEAPRLRRDGLLPPEIARELRPGTTRATEGTTTTRVRSAAAALIPQRDLLVAYGAVIADRFTRFRHRADRAGLDIASITPRARRIWTALFFGGPNGLDYEVFNGQSARLSRDPGWMGSHFGANTIITFLVAAGLSAEDILRLHERERQLYRATRTMSAFIVTAEAEVLDALAVTREGAH